MANTANIDLVKPAGTDHALISVINSNSDKIDAEAGRQRGNFAGTYSSTSGYAVGDYCIYQGNLYRCTTAIGSSGENWTAGHWTSVKVGTELKGLSDQIATLNSVTITINTENVDSNNLFARKLSMTRGVVTINGYATLKNAPTSATVIGTIESGCRPIVNVRSVCAFAEHAYDAPESIGYITISADGVISVVPKSTNNKKVIYFSVAYHAQL